MCLMSRVLMAMRVISRVLLVTCVVVLQIAPGALLSAEALTPIFYRLYLTEGDTLVSYGDYVRVGDRVVFSMPLTANLLDRQTQLVSLPATAVDWAATDRYAESARFDHYARNRGESDFTELSGQVARVLNDIARTDDIDRQLDLARRTRAALLVWTEANYGYREDDIREIVSLLDEAIGGLQPGSADVESFRLNLVAVTARSPRVPILPKPSLQEMIANALTASRLTPVAAERVSMLQTVVGMLDASSELLRRDWYRATRQIAGQRLESELRTSRDYAELARHGVERATEFAADADVRGVQSVIETVRERDIELGEQRPEAMAAIVTAVEVRLTDARALRLARDQWKLRREVFRRYHDEVERALERYGEASRMLDDIRQLAGPGARQLDELRSYVGEAAAVIARVAPPAEVQGVHQLFGQALALAVSAASLRSQAVLTGNMGEAWDAASAAAGSLMLFERAREQLDRSVRMPELP